MPPTQRRFFDTDAAGLAQGRPQPPTAPVLVAELDYRSGVAAAEGRLTGSEGSAAAALGEMIRRWGGVIRPRIEVDRDVRRARVMHPVDDLGRLRAEDRAGYAHAGFIEIALPRNSLEVAVRTMSRHRAVWRLTAAPDISLATGDGRTPTAGKITGRDTRGRNLEPAQGYLHAAPHGIDVGAAWRVKGGRGDGVKICDIEGNWMRSHHDLPRPIRPMGGTPLDDDEWRQHGTAVLGVLAARPNRGGMRGICPDSALLTHSTQFPASSNVARAITRATRHLERGDILLVVVQAAGPLRRFVPVHWWDDVYSALLGATAKGVTSIVAAGNGGEDLDKAAYRRTNLDKDFGGIVVGAGVPPSNAYDVDRSYSRIGQPRAAMPFSNYGQCVHLQGWGWHVATLGYGDGQGGDPRNWLTLRFSGTSSAAPIVAGAAACLQGIAKATQGAPLAPRELRALLIRTGTEQAGRRHIGPLPNLHSAVRGLLRRRRGAPR